MKTKLLQLKIAALALGMFFSINANAFTAVNSGNWTNPATWGGSAPSLTVSNQDIIIPPGYTVTLDADVTFAGLLNNFTINGALTSNSSNWINVTQGTFGGGGMLSVNKITFGTLGISSFTGNMSVKQLVNNNAVLAVAGALNINDSLVLQAGNLNLNNNANLTLMSNAVVKVNNGSMAINGGLFSTGNPYHVMYVGSSKTSGIELNTMNVQNLIIMMNSPSQVLTLNNNITVNSDLNITTGMISLGNRMLTLKGNNNLSAGPHIQSAATSTLMIEGSGMLNSALEFESGASINSFIVNRSSGTVKLASGITVTNTLNLIDGSLSIENGGTVTAGPGSTIRIEKGSLAVNSGTFNGNASYNVMYGGNTGVGSGVELTGSGLNNLSIVYTSNTPQVDLNNNLVLGGALNLTSGKLNMNGREVVLNGTFNGNVNGEFIGSTSSELYLNLSSVNNDTLYFDDTNIGTQTLRKLVIATTGTNYVALGSKLFIENEVNFVKGKFEITTGELEIRQAASIVAYDDQKYFITSYNYAGALKMHVTAGGPFVTFPVGTDVNYSPAYIQQASGGSSDYFYVRSINDVLTNGTSGQPSSGFLKIVNKSWLITSLATNINATLKFGWKGSSEVNGFDRNNAFVSHYENNAWDVQAASSASVGAYTTYELSRSNITSLSPFAVTEVGEPLLVKENSKATGIELSPNPAKNAISVKVGSTPESYRYDMTDITGKTIYSEINDSNNVRFNVENMEPGFYFIKATNLSSKKTVTKRFVKE